eukprot:CAMPEP_0206258098 /NCGR_PEP_ID=MMETSP0047_2-20121206/25724_1 /ASSEMBLY_ACC=CAM_ASM_000192 /TAXON_ID=195065 /ORGANISM="Chroomonas mesostigmatica_cf, Strain CCMP1168" /LENGTH=83 /DNA_ID=CAMNT_0053684791 /DNA_START=106 /DNA_END=354 /DNA_ORIENTATION=+
MTSDVKALTSLATPRGAGDSGRARTSGPALTALTGQGGAGDSGRARTSGPALTGQGGAGDSASGRASGREDPMAIPFTKRFSL